MAWEEFERDGASGTTGDVPLDELALALKAIARAYEDRFARKPTAVEVIYNLERLLRATPERYVSDPDGLIDATILLQRKEVPVKGHVDPERYEAVYSEQPPEYQVVTRGPDGAATTDVVISIPKLKLENDVLRIDYAIRAANLDAEAASALVVEKLLRELLFDRYAESASEIELRDLKTGATRRIPYPTP